MIQKHFINIGKIINPMATPLSPLRGEALNVLDTLDNAYITVVNSKISEIGTMDHFNQDSQNCVDLKGKWVLPSFVDSHTHTVFAKYRSEEFRMRLAGKSYQEIAQAGGGILNSAGKLSQMTEDQLLEDALQRIDKIILKGTGALEIKSGYGLSVEAEIKMLKVIRSIAQIVPIPIKATFLGAHAIPHTFKNDRNGYLDLICHEMLPQIADLNLADYCDVFCETGYFTTEETDRISKQAGQFGLPMKIHTNQFTSIGGVQVAIANQAKSVDHLEILEDQDIVDLSNSSTIATLLPIAPFFLKDPFPKGRALIDHNCAVALATDFNPGSAPSHDMAFAISLACNYCGLTPEEALNAATLNGAFALDLQNEIGSIETGKIANFQVYTAMENISEIPYRICSELLENVIINGEFYNGKI